MKKISLGHVEILPLLIVYHFIQFSVVKRIVFKYYLVQLLRDIDDRPNEVKRLTQRTF
jgi:hypothetical protein